MKIRNMGITLWAAALSLLAPAWVHAEDIDLYTGGLVNGGRPNVIIMLDNSSNWSADNGSSACTYDDTGGRPASNANNKKFGMEQCALNNAIYALQPAIGESTRYNIGFMFFNEGSDPGGYPRKALMELTRDNAAALLTMIKGLDISGDKTNNASFALAMHEALRYFKGGAVEYGQRGRKWDPAAFSGANYISPVSNICQKNYVIIITNGAPDTINAGSTTKVGSDTWFLAQDGGITTPIVYPTSYVKSTDQASLLDEYARFLYGTDLSASGAKQNIVTHTIAVTGASNDGIYPNFYAGVADAGGGKAYTVSTASSLKQVLMDLFNEIQSSNSVFTSSSLPVSVNTQGTYLNQIFMGMFRPDGGGSPRWLGNLKQYQFCQDTIGNLYLGDKTCQPAVSSSTGFITPNAQSYWTTTSNYWTFGTYQSGSPSDAPDGDMVEKGGAAQLQRAISVPANRNLYTCPITGCTASSTGNLNQLSTTPFNTTTINPNSATNQANFGLSSSTDPSSDLTKLINWIRGQNVNNEKLDGGTSGMRPSIHGDVLHSRPVVVNYGNSVMYAFYGSNDGIFRAVNASQSGTDAGKELWGFVIPEFYGKFNRLMNGKPFVKYPSTEPGIVPTPTPRDYFFDGPIGLYQKLSSTGTTEAVHLYIGMRRGGRFIYALDVTTPSNPKFLWKRGCYSNGSCDSGFEKLGQTWSEPKVARIRGNPNPVLIFGGGYDNNAEDPEPPVTPANPIGNAIFIVDANSGNPVKTFSNTDMTKSFPSDMTLVDRDGDGYIDRVYATDMGANVWRLDIDDALPDNWTINKLAVLSTAGNARKIFYPADVVTTRRYDAVLIGTGDREHPLAINTYAYGTQNRFYMLKDPDIGKGVRSPYSTIMDNDVDTSSDLFNATTSSYDGSKRGFFINLGAGEKAVNAPTTIAGFTRFGTNKPTTNAAGQCTNLGIAQGYTVDFINGGYTRAFFEGGGLPPSPVAGLVNITNRDGVTKLVPFIIGGGDDGSGTITRSSAVAGSDVKIKVPKTRHRTFWNKRID